MVTAPRQAGQRRVARGEVWLVALDPTIGSEIRKMRPCLVISPPELQDHLRTLLAAPMTTAGRAAPWRIPIRFDGKDGLVLLEQIRALDRERLVRRLGKAPDQTVSLTLARLRNMFTD